MCSEFVTLRYLSTALESYPSYKTALSAGAGLVAVSLALTWAQISLMQAGLNEFKAEVKAMVTDIRGDVRELQLDQADLRRGVNRMEGDVAAIRSDLATLLHRERSS